METFEHDGVWWDPGNPAERWAGTLRFNSAEGSLLTVTTTIATARWRTYKRILGTTTGGTDVTLFRCFDRSVTWAPAPRKVIYANSLIIGFHCNEPDPLISALSASFVNLDAWWGRPRITQDSSVPWPEVQLHDGENFRTSIRWAPRPSISGQPSTQKIRLEVEAKTPTSLRVFRRVVQSFGDFLSVACLAVCEVEELRLVPPPSHGRGQQSGTLHDVPIYKARENNGMFLFRFADIEHQYAALFKTWFENAEKLRRVSTLYFSGVYSRGFVEGKLLALTQGAEAFHRRFYAGVYMDQAAFERDVLPPLLSAIPASIDDAHRASLRMRLKFANEHSLRKRLNTMVREHEAALAIVVEKPRDFVDPLVNERNAVTHHPHTDVVEPESDSEDPERIVRFNYFLQILLELCFLKAMGFAPEEIVAFARRCETYRLIKQRFFDRVEREA